MSEFDKARARRGEVIRFNTTFGVIEGTVAGMNSNNVIVDQISAYGDFIAIPCAAIISVG